MELMNDPQVWTLIGVFAAAILGGITLLTTQLNRTIIAGFKAIDARFVTVEKTMDAKFDAVDAKFDAVDAKFDAVHVKLDHLDRDVSALSKRVFGIDRTDT